MYSPNPILSRFQDDEIHEENKMVSNIGYCYFQFLQEILQLNAISLYKKAKLNFNNANVLQFLFFLKENIIHKQVKNAQEHFTCVSWVHATVSKGTCCNFQNCFLQYICGI